jgi:hypothetical protein
MLKKVGLGLFALALSGSGVSAQTGGSGGQGAGFPTVGIPADTQCTSFGNPVGGTARCITFAPAGPTAITGAETVLGDTHLPAGQIPQTANIPLTTIGGGKFVLSVNLTGETITVDAQTRQLQLNPAGTLAALTINLPAASTTTPYNGQRFGLCSTQVITALTLGAGTGNTFNPAVVTALAVPPATGAGTCYEWIYSKTSVTAGVWFRVQ